MVDVLRDVSLYITSNASIEPVLRPYHDKIQYLGPDFWGLDELALANTSVRPEPEYELLKIVIYLTYRKHTSIFSTLYFNLLFLEVIDWLNILDLLKYATEII